MDVPMLMNALASYGAVLGCGPRHPRSPHGQLTSRVAKYLSYFPFLKQDTAYVDFMEVYSGTSLYRPAPLLAVDVPGFSDASVGLVKFNDGYYWKGEVNIVTPDRFLIFATLEYATQQRIEVAAAFAFDASGQRPFGVYRADSREAEASDFVWWRASFGDWLVWLVQDELRRLIA